MDPVRYVCKGEDKEDLTEQVRAEIFRKVSIFRLFGRPKGMSWRVKVSCAQGHVNWFSGTGWHT